LLCIKAITYKGHFESNKQINTIIYNVIFGTMFFNDNIKE